MNLFTMGVSARSGCQANSIFAGNLPGLHNSMLKSTQEKMERQQKAGSQIEFWEQQKENLKNMECGTVEEIAKKLEMFHNYEDEIKAVKAAYNMEQMSHILDEAEEQGEKNAEAAEKLEPKTPEERREEMAEEALGADEGEGVLEELMEGMEESLEEILDEATEPMEESLEETLDGAAEPIEESLEEILDGAAEPMEESLEETLDGATGSMEASLEGFQQAQEERQKAISGNSIEGQLGSQQGLQKSLRHLRDLQRLSRSYGNGLQYQGFDAQI